MYAYIMVPEGCVFTVLGSLLCPHTPSRPHYAVSLWSAGSRLRFSFHILVVEPIEWAVMRSSVTLACCCFPKLFLIVFRENHCDMSVGIVNITQRKYYKDTLHLLRHMLLKPSLREAELYLSNPSTKEKWLFREQIKQSWLIWRTVDVSSSTKLTIIKPLWPHLCSYM